MTFTLQLWFKGVIPFTMKVVCLEFDGLHVGVRNLDALGVFLFVQGGFHAQSRLRAGGPNEVH